MAVYRILLLLLLISAGASAQVNRYIVFFKDKTGSSYNVGEPLQFLSQKSIDRRVKQTIAVTTEDLPVSQAYVAQADAAAGRPYYTSRWMNAVLMEVDQDSVDQITALTCVREVHLVAPGTKFSGGRVRKVKNKFSANSSQAVASLPQLRQLGMDEMHDAGFHGEGISIAVMDGGFAAVDVAVPFQSIFQRNGIRQTYNFVTRSENVYANCSGCSHGTEVLSTMAVSTADYTGGSYAADYFLYVTEDDGSEYKIEEYNWIFAAEKADSAGVDIISTSLGYNEFDDSSMDYLPADMDGKTTAISRGAAIALSKGIVVVVSAGNAGNSAWRIITSPADTKGVLAVGAVTLDGELAAFSSVGPSADGRIKPDVAALGVATSFILNTGAIGSGNGTSFACPLVASLAAGIKQAYPFLSSGQVYEAMIRSADRYDSPNNEVGYGIPNFPRVKEYIDATNIVSVYPNPYLPGSAQVAADHNRIKVNFNFGVGETQFIFYDLLGRVVVQETLDVEAANSSVGFDISGFASGVYIIKIKNSFSTKTVRFIKG